MQARYPIAPQTTAAPQSPQTAGGERTAKVARQFDAAIGMAKAAYNAQPQPKGGSTRKPHGDTARAAASHSGGSPTDVQVKARHAGEATTAALQPIARGRSPRGASATDATSRERRAQSPASKSTGPTATAASSGDVLDTAVAASEGNSSQAPVDGTLAAVALDGTQGGLLLSIALPTATPPDPQSQDASVQAGLEQSVDGQRGSFERPPTAPITGPEVATDDATVQRGRPSPQLAGAAASEQGRSAPAIPPPDELRALADRSGEVRPTHTPASHGPSAAATPSPVGPESGLLANQTTAAPAHQETTAVASTEPPAQPASPVVMESPPSVSQSSAASAPATSHSSTPASPASQVAPVLVSLAHTPDGATQLTVRLDPPELGRVEVRIDRPADAPARVEITVEKAETLTLLLRDQQQLQHALDRAGVPVDGRSVTFHIASPEPASRNEWTTPAAPGAGAGGLSGDGSHGAWRQGGQPGRRHAGTNADSETELTPIAMPDWARAGLNITA
jgi:flagellar hook-length control protein FliK